MQVVAAHFFVFLPICTRTFAKSKGNFSLAASYTFYTPGLHAARRGRVLPGVRATSTGGFKCFSSIFTGKKKRKAFCRAANIGPGRSPSSPCWPASLFFAYPSGDYTQFLQPWFEDLKAAGGLAAIGLPVGDYMVTYLYILALLHLPLPGIVSIKIVSCVGDLVLAIYGMRAAKLLTNSESTASRLYRPFVFAHRTAEQRRLGAVRFALHSGPACMLFIIPAAMPKNPCLPLGRRWHLSCRQFFLAPFLFSLWLQGRVKIPPFLFWCPAVYLLAILPAFLAGRPLADLLTIYLRQTGTYTQLSMGGAKPVCLAWLAACFLAHRFGRGAWRRGSPLSLCICCVKKCRTPPVAFDKSGISFALMLPFLLPRMHERYFYPSSDVFSVLYFYSADTPQKRVIPLITVFCSFFSAADFYLMDLGKPALLSLPLLCALILLCRDTLARCPIAVLQNRAPAVNGGRSVLKTQAACFTSAVLQTLSLFRGTPSAKPEDCQKGLAAPSIR